MSKGNVQFVDLYRPGRAAVIVAILLLLLIVTAFSLTMYGMLNVYIFPGIVVLPFVVLVLDSLFRKRLLPCGTSTSELASQLKKLKVHWILKRNGCGIRRWKREELQLPRTIADSSLAEELCKVTIPGGLVEPEQIGTSKPGSLLGCIFGVTISLFVIWGMFLSLRMRFSSMYIFWIVIVMMSGNILQLILGLPIVHRSRKLPAFLRTIGRRQLFRRPIIVGPGWVKLGKTVWLGDRDMLFIRRTGFRLASSEIDCLLVGPEKRRRMTFSGVGDEDFQLLFGFWNVDDVRSEFVDSELS